MSEDDKKGGVTGFATKPFLDSNYMREKRNVDPLRTRLFEYISGQKLFEEPEIVRVKGPKSDSEGVEDWAARKTQEGFEIYEDHDKNLVAARKTGNWNRVYRKVNEPKLNDEGTAYLLSAFDLTINNQTVQGNIKRDELRVHLGRKRKQLAGNLWENAEYYGLDMRHYHEIIGEFMDCAELFLTRPIDNKERESDTQSTKYVESHGQERGSGGGRRGVRGLLGL